MATVKVISFYHKNSSFIVHNGKSRDIYLKSCVILCPNFAQISTVLRHIYNV